MYYSNIYAYKHVYVYPFTSARGQILTMYVTSTRK